MDSRLAPGQVEVALEVVAVRSCPVGKKGGKRLQKDYKAEKTGSYSVNRALQTFMLLEQKRDKNK
jgi:hypothetical protein